MYTQPSSDEDTGWVNCTGLLVLTNARLTVILDTGLIKKGFQHHQSVELASIGLVSVLKKDLLVEWMGVNRPVKNKYERLEEFDFVSMSATGAADPQRVAGEILAARSGASIPAAVLDFNTVLQSMARGGRVLGLRCPRCGKVMQFPTYGAEVWCPFCQASIRAEQVQSELQLIVREG